ncbi:MAG: hypothetical protein WCH61_04920, partial [bacterium]
MCNEKILILLTLALISLTVSGQSPPSSVNLSAELPPIGDQGTVGLEDMTCQLWAASIGDSFDDD